MKVKPRQCVITFYEPGLGREVKAGKFVWLQVSGARGYMVYVNNVSLEWDLMRDLDAWGIAPCVLEAMKSMDIDEIHFVCREEGMTYIATPAEVRRFGELRKYGSRGTHWHLARRYWRRNLGTREYPWVNREWNLRWLEPERVEA
ncbi:MAG TPA: hypothetical protein VMW58_02105 [Anaerolineae bacterium]|nr:hypothetical protein [Anaerolineae bacterium]